MPGKPADYDLELVKLESYLLMIANIDDRMGSGQVNDAFFEKFKLNKNSTFVDLNEKFFGLNDIKSKEIDTMQKAYQKVFEFN